MVSSSDDVEDVIVQGLANQDRRNILKVIKLAKDGAIYSNILAELEMNSGSLNYHLRQLEGLISKNAEGRYVLTPLGEKALKGLYSMTEDLENGYEKYLNKAKNRQKPSMFPAFAGVLSILASCFLCVFGIIVSLLIAQVLLPGKPSGDIAIFPWMFNVVFNYLGFAIGLATGIFLLKRRHFGFSLGASCLLLLFGIFNFLAFLATGDSGSGLFLALYMGLPVVVFSILSVVFVSTSKNEFN